MDSLVVDTCEHQRQNTINKCRWEILTWWVLAKHGDDEATTQLTDTKTMLNHSTVYRSVAKLDGGQPEVRGGGLAPRLGLA